MITTLVSNVLEGSRLCIASSRRLNEAASILIDGAGDDGLVYGLWSLAIEQYGMACLLADQVRGRAAAEAVSVQPGFDHRQCLARGLEELREIGPSPIWRELVVKWAPTESTHVRDPVVPGAGVTVGAGTSGTYIDNETSVAPTVDLRFALFYVAWDSTTQRWTDNRSPYTGTTAAMSWRLPQDQLRKAIDALDTRLHAA